MGGELNISSQKAKGCAFYFRLTFEKDVIAAKSTIQPDIPVTTTHQKSLKGRKQRENNGYGLSARWKVLVVEDSEVNQIVAKTMLQKLGADVTIAENGEIAVELWREQRFDLIFMDCQMPVLDGYQATLKIRALEQDDEHVLIIALTANVMREEKDRCLAIGFDDFIGKPVNKKAFSQILDKYLGMLHNRHQA